MTEQTKEKAWIFRTYGGHSNAQATNELFKKNLAKGQTGLSVAFDLPTQTGYDSDHVLSRGEVGKVGVPISHIDDMMTLFHEIPVEQMNTSMTINATAAWLLALYIAVNERQGGQNKNLQGTTQNDILKEYLSRGTYAFPPEPSLRLTTDIISYTYKHLPKWNPVNVCPYHLQEAGATPVQELSYGLLNALTFLDAVKASGQVPAADFSKVVGRISFFLDSGIRFIEEMCKVRAFTQMWQTLCEERYGVQEEQFKRFRYGVQVNSLGLTEAQPENNIIRIVLEALGVTLSKDARARALQLPAWNEALGLPRPFDQQWSLRIQQILAYETDLLEYADIFNGSPVIQNKVDLLVSEAKAEIQKVEEMGGVVKAIESGYIKSQLVLSNARRVRDIETGAIKVVGVNCYQQAEPSPLSGDGAILKIDAASEKNQIQKLQAFREKRNQQELQAAVSHLEMAIKNGENIMPASIRCAHAGMTTGEWAGVFRKIFGEYRAPTGVAAVSLSTTNNELEQLRLKVKNANVTLGHHFRLLVGKPGLDGHSNGAEQIAVKAREAGMEVIYQGIRCTPEEIVNTALQEDVDVIGLSILSGSHLSLIPEILSLLTAKGLKDLPVVIGGIIPDEDAAFLVQAGVRRVYTPKDYQLNQIMNDIVDVVLESHHPI